MPRVVPGLVRCSAPTPSVVRGLGFLRLGRASRGDFREAEVEDFGVAAFGDENVGGLDVAMDDAFGVGGVECVGDFDGDAEETIEFEGLAGDDVLERDAIEKFHGDEGCAVFFADVVDGADVGMIERGGGLGFALEAGEGLRIVGDVVGEELQGDEAAERVSSAL